MTEPLTAPFRAHNDVIWDGEVVRCRTRPQHANVGGGIHGGLIATMLDAVMGGSVILALPEGKGCVTSSLTVNYLAAARIGDELVASAVVRKIGSTLAYVDGTCVRSSDGRELATATGVFAVTSRRVQRRDDA